MVRAAESNPAIAIQYKMVDQWKEIAGEQVKAFEHINLGNITVFDGGNGGTSNFLNTLVKTVAPSLGVLDKLPIGETVKGIINPESKTEEKPAGKTEEKKNKSSDITNELPIEYLNIYRQFVVLITLIIPNRIQLENYCLSTRKTKAK